MAILCENFKMNLYCFDLQDYHCHLTSSEVVGYIAGKFDPQSHRKCINYGSAFFFLERIILFETWIYGNFSKVSVWSRKK